MDYKIRYIVPRKMTAANIDSFLAVVEGVFDFENKMLNDFLFDISKTEKADIVGVLLIYKFFEFTVQKKCFTNPSAKFSKEINDEIIKYGLKDLIARLKKTKDPKYDKLRSVIDEQLLIAPICLCRFSNIENRLKEVGFQVVEFYADTNTNNLILTCLGELSQNFLDHAEGDSQSIISITGTKQWFQIACVDTGEGIISSLTESLRNGRNIDKKKFILKALDKGISSKDNSNGNMGYGLWIIKELCLAAKGELSIFSEGYYVKLHNGNVKYGSTSYWKGTIVSLKISLFKKDKLTQILREMLDNRKNIKINIR